jgi:hypothetical protein
MDLAFRGGFPTGDGINFQTNHFNRRTKKAIEVTKNREKKRQGTPYETKWA